MHVIHTDVPLYAFNTGRQYSSKGQRIAWVPILGTAQGVLVAFYDVDRMINGVVRIDGVISDDRVLAAYDAGGYTQHGWISHTLQDALKAAAEALR